jgi:hypothetical protein
MLQLTAVSSSRRAADRAVCSRSANCGDLGRELLALVIPDHDAAVVGITDIVDFMRVHVVSSVPPGKGWDSALNCVTTDSFCILSNSLFTSNPAPRCYIERAINSVIK